MSRYPDNDYRRSPPRWNQDRRASYNEPPRPGRGRELRDAPPLGARGNYRDPRDFSPRDIRDEPPPPPRQRRNSRDAPLTAGPIYSDPPAFRGGFSRGRGARGGDPGFRGGSRGGRPRFADDRELFPPDRTRDRSPPRYFRDGPRDDRSPDKRDERPYGRREDSRWPDRTDRERDLDRARRPEPLPRQDSRPGSEMSLGNGSAASASTLVNPDRLALIEDNNNGDLTRRPPVPNTAAPREIRRDAPEIPAYLNGRAETASSRYAARGSSPPTQPPPVPAFTLSFAPVAPNPVTVPSKPVIESKNAGQTTISEISKTLNEPPRSSIAPIAPRAAVIEPTPAVPRAFVAEIDTSSVPKAPRAGSDTSIAPRGPRAEHDTSTTPRLSGSKSWETLAAPIGSHFRQPAIGQSASPTMHSATRPTIITAPTGPKADRTSSQPSLSPRVPFASLNRDMAGPGPAPPSQLPLPPSGPRSHGPSLSPEITFAAAPTAPKADRLSGSALRGPASITPGIRGNDRSALSTRGPPAAPKIQAWNQWRRPEQGENTITERQGFSNEERRPHFHQQSHDLRTNAEDKMDVDTHQSPKPAAAGHSAKQSFFGKPSDDNEDEQDMSDVVDDSLSTTDEDELEVEDLALFEAKFERQRRELEAKILDLSLQRYRATTPLETMARLVRISMKDVERFNERDAEMDVDEPQSVSGDPSVPPATHSSESEEAADLLTPKAEEDNTTVLIHDGEEHEELVRRIRRPTPELVRLPFMIKDTFVAYQDTDDFKQHMTTQHEMEHDFEAEVVKDLQLCHQDEDDLEGQFSDIYQHWRVQCEDFDYEREEQERAERQASFEPGPEPEPPVALAANPLLEGRRAHKFSSQYEIDLVIRESEEMARIEQEKSDREAKKIQADMEKEAVIPDQMSENELQHSIFIDNNRLREPETLTMVFTYEPAPDDFTEQEQQIFVGAFKETPKKWSEIASLLPGREPKDCIRHYYANKWDGRFRDTRARKLKGRRGRGTKSVRGKGSAMADLARAEDVPVAVSDSGRPKRAAAPISFGEKESDAKALLAGQSPAKRAGPGSTKEGGQADGEKPAKRRKAIGDKPGRKPKGAQQLASLAAAPTLSPDGRPPQSQTKESIDRSRLEDASLLTGFHAGRPAAIHAEPPAIFTAADGGFISHRPLEDAARSRAPMQAQSAKSSPSSYWSVPEQNDFNKYIKYFGTDFGAIATHMGTKTQTMIKNHYQRQVDGGNRQDLEADALNANARRERGDDMGAPPVPTPIIKRKYDQPPTTTNSRSLQPHGEPMDMDDGARAHSKQHASPPQFQMQPRYQHTPGSIQSGRAAGESSATPTLSAAAPARPFPPRMSIFSDPRAESRPSLSAASSFMAPQLGTPTGQPAQPSRTVQEAQDPHFIQSLLDEQNRARQIQGHYQRQDRLEPYHRPSLQQSPPTHSAILHGDRKPPMGDQRTNSPPSGFFSSKAGSASSTSRSFDPLRYPAHHSAMPSPPKREDPRTAVASNVPFSQPAHPAEPPKRSNVMSLLNDTTEEPKPTSKGSSMDTPAPVITRHGSPAQHGSMQPSGYGGLSQPREIYGQPSVGQSHYARPSMPAPPVSSALKQEPLSSAASSMSTKQEWPARGAVHGTHTPPSGPSFDRGSRSYFTHPSSMLGQLGTPGRANPSPPPHSSLHHSRTSSLSTAEPTSHRASYVSQPHAGSGSAHQSSLYAQQGHPPAFSQAPPASSLTPGHDHQQQHAPSIGGGYSAAHQRAQSRDDRPGQYFIERDREREWRLREQEDVDRRRAEAQRMAAEQRHYEQDRHYSRSGPPLPPHQQQPQPQQPQQQQQQQQQQHHAPPYGLYEQTTSRHESGMNMREQSMREAHLAMQHEEERLRNTAHYREREQAEEARRRHDDAYMPGARRTPLGGGFGVPSLPPSRR